ncbi:MAG TPA: TlpA disulfide reductase family protein [Verrucomicrobiae bacterium]|nr:TlpA disulfide reductase family protein [Verrucomicrobiae bacterium]
MRNYWVATIICAIAVSVSLPRALAAESTNTAAELQALVSKVQDKLHDGKKTESDLAPELKEFDSLLEKHKSEKNDDTAQIVLMKAMLYLEVLDNTEKGTELVQQLKQDYPDTKAGKNADAILENIKSQEAAKKIQRALVEGATFPDFDEKDIDGKPLSVAGYKGKVVLLDFWATWCGPCVLELPNVVKAYEKHHDQGFEIIGVSLDQDEERLKSFIKQKNVTWRQYFDGKGWSNKLAQKYGIQSIPATFLLNGEGKIIGRDLRGEALEEAVTKALGKK